LSLTATKQLVIVLFQKPIQDAFTFYFSEMAVIKSSIFSIAFLMYMAVSSAVLIMCVVFLFLDDSDNGKNKTIYASIVTFIIGKWTGFLVAHGAKSRTKELRKVMDHQNNQNGEIKPGLMEANRKNNDNSTNVHSNAVVQIESV